MNTRLKELKEKIDEQKRQIASLEPLKPDCIPIPSDEVPCPFSCMNTPNTESEGET